MVTRLIGLRRFLMLVCAVLIGTTAFIHATPPAGAQHITTSCNNDPSGIDEVFFEWNNLVFVGVDLGLGDLLGSETRVVCAWVVGVDTSLRVTVIAAPAGFAGRTLSVSLCTPTCTTILGQTGVFVNLTAPLFSCIYLNGVQQNPGCPL